jgi:Protein of unknown function (DUF2950)
MGVYKRSTLGSMAVLATVGAFLVTAGYAATPSSGGEGFNSPEEAAKAIVAAAKSQNVANVLKILGPSAREILVTGDPVADRNVRQQFAERAAEKMQVVSDPKHPGWKIIEVGNDNWPLPIPIVEANGQWRFDTDKGKHEILLRRIGNDELSAIEICRGYVEAQNEYAERDHTGGHGPRYAQKVASSPGQRDGLYWKSDDPNDESPIAEIFARATKEGYTKRTEPYHGYFFKVLKGQGPHASGGAMSYLDNGAMTRGFALIAWPSNYGSTGVMTFLVDKTGIVYQKDLGPQTARIAAATNVYDPDQKWTPVPDTVNP